MRALARALALGRNPFKNPLESFTDLELVVGMCEKDHMCFEVFYNRHKESLYFFLFRLTSRADISEELMQEAFLKFFASVSRFDQSQSQVKTWLFNIARNCAIDYFRKKAETSLEGVEVELFQEEGTVNSEQEELMLRNAEQEELGAAIAKLPLAQREALLLWMQEFTYEEMAQMSGKSVQAMKNLINRARTRLVKELGGSER